jgi:hypothetical protein
VKSLIHLYSPAIAAALLSVAVGIACYLAAGPSLDFYLGTVLMAAILTPATALGSEQQKLRWMSVVVIVVALSTVWLAAGAVSAFAWIQCVLVLTGFVVALAAAAILLYRLGLPPVLAAAIVTVLSLAWLTWPIWACSALRGQAIVWPVAIHPLFAINSACRDLGIWTEQRIAYRLTNMGQDVAYRLPASVLPCVAVHLIMAAVLTALGWKWAR